MRRLVVRSAAATGALLVLAACGGGEQGGSAEPADDNSQPSAAASTEPADDNPRPSAAASPEPANDNPRSPAAASTVETAESGYGTILVDAEGMTLYMFDPDEQGPSVCDAECLQAWPIVEGPAEAGRGVDDSLLGTTDSTAGTTMATYNDWPLYYFVKDKAPGDVTGQGVGGVWWVIGPDGKPIRETSPDGG